MERVACYIRVSSQEQKLHGISLDAQRDKLTDYADKHNLKIVEWYEDEGISGRKLIRNRPALQEMLKDAQAGKFDRILFIKLDRFFRSVAEYHECMKLIDPVVWTATEEKYDLTTANGRAFVNMKLTIAELEADQTGERIKIVNDYKVKTGQALTGSQNQGLGFIVKKVDGIKKVFHDPETEALCKEFIEHFLVYQNRRQSVIYINKKYGTCYNYNTFKNFLTDEKICGLYRGNPNYCEPYIDKRTFDIIQGIVAKNIKEPKSKRIYLFSGLIRCPECKSKMAGCCSNKRTNRRPNGKIYVYCSDRKYYRCNNHVVTSSCNFDKRMSEPALEKQLLSRFDDFVSEYVSETSVSDARRAANIERIQKKISSIKTEMSKVQRMYRKEDISEAEYDDAMNELKEEMKEQEARLVPVVNRNLAAYESLLKSGWTKIYSSLNDLNKRAFWRTYISELVIDKDGNIADIVFN